MEKILVIQTAFIGDVILATAVLEKLHQFYPTAEIDILVRMGNEGLFQGHPFLKEVMLWDKRQRKYRNLLTLLAKIRSKRYDLVVNLQRFFTTGALTVFSGARQTVGFSKNPLSFAFTRAFPHDIGTGKHEIERNHLIIAPFTDQAFCLPKLYPPPFSDSEYNSSGVRYITIAPASVWFTKQYPAEKWIEFISKLPNDIAVYLLGGKEDKSLCDFIKSQFHNKRVESLAGSLNLLQSATLMKHAVMNFAGDSAPIHLASAVNAPVTAVFCSTVPSFGFGPLSEMSFVVETTEKLECRPCGLHGKSACPEGHFKCADIPVEFLLSKIG